MTAIQALARDSGAKVAVVQTLLLASGAAVRFNMIGNGGAAYPVQTLWSNTSLNGADYCSGGL